MVGWCCGCYAWSAGDGAQMGYSDTNNETMVQLVNATLTWGVANGRTVTENSHVGLANP